MMIEFILVPHTKHENAKGKEPNLQQVDNRDSQQQNEPICAKCKEPNFQHMPI
jgi:hypothetical protein